MHPVLFSIGDFYIGTYGLFMALGLLFGSAAALWRAGRLGVRAQDVMDLIFYGVVAGIVGSRLAYVAVDLFTEQRLLANPLEIVFSRTNFVFLGGILLALPVCALVAKKRNQNFFQLADILAASVPLGHAFGRIGCFFAGCCYGSSLSPDSPCAFLAVRFPEDSLAGPGGVWPVQLLESAGNLAIFFLLFIPWKRRRFHGQILLCYILLYGMLRFSLEFLRGDDAERGVAFLSTSQYICLFGILLVPFLWHRLRRTQTLRREPRNEAAPAPDVSVSSNAPVNHGEKRQKKRRR